jgi:1-hydroxycarotenoid 3,4-desaturase
MLSRGARIVIIGAGVGGLAAAARLAALGAEVEVLERAAAPGGKMRAVSVGGSEIDVGPTVLTMRWAFEELFAAAGADFASAVPLKRAGTLARHFWRDGAQLDLYDDVARSAEAIRAFAGPREAKGYLAFARDAERAFRALDAPFIRAERPNLPELIARLAKQSPRDLFAFSPFADLWGAVGRYFRDPRLRQLFGRYATYCGASPFEASATLMLVAHVEREGVWVIEGGLRRLARALAALAEGAGARIRYGCEVARLVVEGGRVGGVETSQGERIAADAVVFNGDIGALAAGMLGGASGVASPPPSLSAVTWALRAPAGAPWRHHNVLFGDDYKREFDAVFKRNALPRDPTIYVCAEQRETGAAAGADEPLFVLVNAPPHRPEAPLSEGEIAACEQATSKAVSRLGVSLDWAGAVRTTPRDFATLFPGSRGALYGPPPHGWRASFQREGARAATPGLYLAGGTVHPGAGVPMAALSGALAAAAVAADLGLTARSRPAATRGGISTRSATTGNTG